ncbi:LCP family protein [Desulfitobacterium sp. AusDCA]|uniref:LCP family protein n=1 Tax=Desulfitobacterium sp. AusDCA TaxID=3240383 RepID=UPI003DA78F81
MIRKKEIIILFVILGIISMVSGYVLFFRTSQISNPFSSKGQSGEDSSGRISFLLIGADQRPGDEKYNTDSLILASIDPVSHRISMLSIPRDTRVSIPGHSNVKINSVVALTNLETLQNVVSHLTGISVAGYIQTNFSGFKQIIDTLGGVTVDVEKDMYYETGDKTDGYINLKKGEQRLNGSEALQYARFRYDALADISRTARQQVVLKAVAREMLQASTLPKLPWLVPQLSKAVHTNLSLSDMLKLSKVAVGFDKTDIVSQTLPGKFLDVEGVSYWDVDPREAKKVANNLLQGITTAKIIDDQDVDLLKPIITAPSQSLPKVPGNALDPNGQQSTGYEDVEVHWPLGADGGA